VQNKTPTALVVNLGGRRRDSEVKEVAASVLEAG